VVDTSFRESKSFQAKEDIIIIEAHSLTIHWQMFVELTSNIILKGEKEERRGSTRLL
jgi:hypothetical protein